MAKDETFIGRLVENAEVVSSEKKPVRNDVAQPGREIAVLRYWKIKKGGYEEFRRVSEEGVWPFFEKIGARIVGMWKVVPPPDQEELSPDWDEVYLLTRYASVDHWKMTREASRLGGNGPDWEKCRDALRVRYSLALETSARFLEGGISPGGPYYMPGLDEKYLEKS